MSLRPTAYIAGPMRGIFEYNFPAFLEAEEALQGRGWQTVCPARRDIDNGFEYQGLTGNEDLAELGFDLRDALAWDLDQIARECDAVIVLPGWENSRGATAEVATAKALGLQVLTLGDALWPYLEGDKVRIVRKGFYRLSYGDEATGPDHAVGDECEVKYVYSDGDLYVSGGDIVLAPCCVVPVHPEPEPESPAMRDVTALSGLTPADVVEVGGLPNDEVRVTSATGGQKGKKPAQLATVDPIALLELAKVSGFGAGKYEAFNYVRGYDWSLSADAAFRHLLAFLAGEDNDPESGLPHPAHFAWHGLALTSFLLRGVGTDDRVESVLANYKQEGVAA